MGKGAEQYLVAKNVRERCSHEEGERELDMCRAMFSAWQQGSVTCIETSFINQQGKPPVVFVAAKKPAAPMRLDQR